MYICINIIKYHIFANICFFFIFSKYIYIIFYYRCTQKIITKNRNNLRNVAKKQKSSDSSYFIPTTCADSFLDPYAKSRFCCIFQARLKRYTVIQLQSENAWIRIGEFEIYWLFVHWERWYFQILLVQLISKLFHPFPSLHHIYSSLKGEVRWNEWEL